jgi:surfactin synthase thioesterase subunit
MKLLCFPYAGGSSVKFLPWKKYLDGIEVIPVDLSGRGRRMAEPLCETIGEMADDLKKQVVDLVSKEEKYAVYGHSMGALLVYELLHKLLESDFHMPVHVFLSGKNQPHYLSKKPIYHLEEPKFIKKIIDMGGMPPAFFDNPMMKKMYLPVFRTDFRIVETYQYEKKEQRLPIDITFFFALFDVVICNKQTKRWADYITGSFKMRYFFGGHFFFIGQEKKITGIIKEILLRENENAPC